MRHLPVKPPSFNTPLKSRKRSAVTSASNAQDAVEAITATCFDKQHVEMEFHETAQVCLNRWRMVQQLQRKSLIFGLQPPRKSLKLQGPILDVLQRE